MQFIQKNNYAFTTQNLPAYTDRFRIIMYLHQNQKNGICLTFIDSYFHEAKVLQQESQLLLSQT